MKAAWEEGELDVANVEQARVSQGFVSCDRWPTLPPSLLP